MPSRTSHVRLRPLPSYSRPRRRAATARCAGTRYGASGIRARASSRSALVERVLAGVAERRVAEVVAERDRLGQVLVEPQRARDRARDLRDLERVRQARAVVVALGREEDLRLVREAPERLAVDDAVAVALEVGAERVRRRSARSRPRVSSAKAAAGCEPLVLGGLDGLARHDVRHGTRRLPVPVDDRTRVRTARGRHARATQPTSPQRRTQPAPRQPERCRASHTPPSRTRSAAGEQPGSTRPASTHGRAVSHDRDDGHAPMARNTPRSAAPRATSCQNGRSRRDRPWMSGEPASWPEPRALATRPPSEATGPAARATGPGDRRSSGCPTPAAVSASVACAAASRASGTRYGEQTRSRGRCRRTIFTESGSPPCSPQTPSLMLGFAARPFSHPMRTSSATPASIVSNGLRGRILRSR